MGNIMSLRGHLFCTKVRIRYSVNAAICYATIQSFVPQFAPLFLLLLYHKIIMRAKQYTMHIVDMLIIFMLFRKCVLHAPSGWVQYKQCAQCVILNTVFAAMLQIKKRSRRAVCVCLYACTSTLSNWSRWSTCSKGTRTPRCQ